MNEIDQDEQARAFAEALAYDDVTPVDVSVIVSGYLKYGYSIVHPGVAGYHPYVVLSRAAVVSGRPRK